MRRPELRATQVSTLSKLPAIAMACRSWRTEKPVDLLLIDIVMPQVNGFALARMARMRHLGLKSVYITAYDVPTDEAIGPVLKKPLADGALLAEVQRVLAG